MNRRLSWSKPGDVSVSTLHSQLDLFHCRVWDGLSAEERQQRSEKMNPRIFDYTQADIDAYEESTTTELPTRIRGLGGGRKCTIKNPETETALSYHGFDSFMAEFNDR